MKTVQRRAFVRSIGAAPLAGLLAGCSGGDSDGEDSGDIVAGPGGRPEFEPVEYTVSVGEAVEWYFDSPSHNVSAVPEHSQEVVLPDGAAPFASYGVDGNRGETDPTGSTYRHTFETAGEYTYVCVPHVRVGMIATVVVEE